MSTSQQKEIIDAATDIIELLKPVAIVVTGDNFDLVLQAIRNAAKIRNHTTEVVGTNETCDCNCCMSGPDCARQSDTIAEY